MITHLFFSLSLSLSRSSNANEVVGNYVQHVFVMAPGILTLIGSLLVLSLQPSVLACKTKGWSINKREL